MGEIRSHKMKRWSLLVCLMFVCLPSGCKKEDVSTTLPLQEVWTMFETEENVFAYTLDENGNLYTLEYDMNAQEESDGLTAEKLAQMTPEEIMQLSPEELDQLAQNGPDCFFVRKYDAKGEREYSKALEDSLGSYVKTMAVKDGTVYFVPYTVTGEEMRAVLYSYCLETEELTAVKELPYFKSVSRIVPMEDCFYLLGSNVEGMPQRDSRKYEHTGEMLFCYTVSEDKFVELGIEEPIDVCAAGEEELCVYAHMGDEFCLLLFDTSRDSMKVMARKKEYKMANVAFSNEGQEVIYQTVSRGLVLSSLSDLAVESELYPDGRFWDNNICYVNGRVACETGDGRIVQFPLKDVKCENKALRYITAKTETSEPFGCGYEMHRSVLEMDKFALKVMALDKDFDVCFVDSRDSYSYNLMKNGVFYPLNEIEGIQEYLDACFPYVRETATDKGGNIWMLPIAVDIPGLLVSREAMDEILIKKGMTYREYCSAYEALSEEEKMVTENPASYSEAFIKRYILERGTVDTEEFREVLQGMAKSNSVQTEDIDDRYCRILFESDYRAYFALQYGTDATIYAEPKLTAEDKNVGSCMFLAVNPYSDNLETTLQYISALIAYTMEREDAPLFFENRPVEETAYERSLYELYRDGTIAFSVDNDVYAGYSDVLNGTLSLEEYIAETETKVKIFLNE